MSKSDVDPVKVKECVDKSWVGSFSDYKTATDNTILASEVKAFNDRGIIVWPAVVINDNVYRGDLLPAKHVFEAICESYDKMPEPC